MIADVEVTLAQVWDDKSNSLGMNSKQREGQEEGQGVWGDSLINDTWLFPWVCELCVSEWVGFERPKSGLRICQCRIRNSCFPPCGCLLCPFVPESVCM